MGITIVGALTILAMKTLVVTVREYNDSNVKLLIWFV